jgi:hypothetical protein
VAATVPLRTAKEVEENEIRELKDQNKRLRNQVQDLNYQQTVQFIQ